MLQTAGQTQNPAMGVMAQTTHLHQQLEAESFGSRRQEFWGQGEMLERDQHVVRQKYDTQPRGVGAKTPAG